MAETDVAQVPQGPSDSHHSRLLRRRFDNLTMSDYVSFIQRVVMVTILLALRALGILEPSTAPAWVLDVGIAVMLALAIFGAGALLISDIPARRVLRISFVPDLISIVLIIWATGREPDPIYPWVIGLALIYGVGLRRSESIYYSAVFASGYLVAQVLGNYNFYTFDEYVFVVFKAAAIVVTAVLISEAARRQLQREAETRKNERTYFEQSRDLQARLTEFHAVADINEIIHSTLDFEQVGHFVLEIVSKVIDLPASALVIIDKRRDETLFSASFGFAKELGEQAAYAAQGFISDGGETFACTTILDRGNLMVVFCAPGERLETLAEDDRLLLLTVANDLSVAVENSELYKLTKRLSVTDELTGLYNYRFLLSRMDEEIDRSRRFERPLSLLMIDADKFKDFNDTHGHIAGDAALAELAGALRRAVRDVDIVCRYGGEEFAVLLPETDSEGAFVVAEKVRESVATHSFPNAKGVHSQRLTISVGLSSFPRSADDREELLQQADHALYTAKRMGRNRVNTWRADFAFDDDTDFFEARRLGAEE